MEWTEYWQNLLRENKLSATVKELDSYERSCGREPQTERICKGIYDCYDEKAQQLLEVKRDCMKELDAIDGIHLSCGRVKEKDSLLCKVIKKRSENITAFDSKYYQMDECNYDKIITDLIGLRLIINYRGKWLSIHKQILDIFPLADAELYEKQTLLEHDLKKRFLKEQFQAEWPKVYYAYGDAVQEYIDEGLDTRLSKTGYRSIHYILSFKDTYIELQMRTIYDEAWSDCDHSYVYKKNHNSSHDALAEMSIILNALTNVSGCLNDVMKSVYDGEKMKRDEKKTGWIAQTEIVNDIDDILEKLKETENDFNRFREKIISAQEGRNEADK